MNTDDKHRNRTGERSRDFGVPRGTTPQGDFRGGMSILAHDFLRQQTSADAPVHGDLNDGLENPSSVAEARLFSFHGS
jgi:hypothetical protein